MTAERGTGLLVQLFIIVIVVVIMMAMASAVLPPPTTMEAEHRPIIGDGDAINVTGDSGGITIEFNRSPSQLGVTTVFAYYRGDEIGRQTVGPFEKKTRISINRVWELDGLEIGESKQVNLVLVNGDNEVRYESQVVLTRVKIGDFDD